MAGKKSSSSASGGRKRARLPHREAPQLFFSLARARITDALTISKVVTVELPLSHIRDRAALHEFVLKKLLHKPYEPSSEELSALTSDALCTTASLNSSPSWSGGDEGGASAAFLVVHVDNIEVHAETVRQSNSRGDVQMNVMVTMTVARVVHGLLTGAAALSPYAGCMLVTVPVIEDQSTSLTFASWQKGDEPTGQAAVQHHKLTVRCLEEEPVTAGQAVLVVSEPGGGLRCLAVRPPRKAPGPFRLEMDTEDKAGRRVRIECDKPDVDSSKPHSKRPGTSE